LAFGICLYGEECEVSNPRILVVDDEMIVCESCKRILEEDGYEVETALIGMEAFEKMKENPFDIAITDLKMPGIDGTYEHSWGFCIDYPLRLYPKSEVTRYYTFVIGA
jgi:hypothetical protein